MTSFKRSQSKYVKQQHKVTNWAQYDEALVNRGSLTIWISDDAISNWNAEAKGKPGGQLKYSALAIETASMVRLVYHLPWRQTKGFLLSLADKLELPIDIPHHTTFSRRARKLGKMAIHKVKHDRPIHILIDSTGVKVHNGNLRKPPKKRAWRKFHVAVDAKTGDVIACDLTSSRAQDPTRVPALISQIENPLASASADAAYDAKVVYEALANHTEDRVPRVLIPPKKNAILDEKNESLSERNRNIRSRNKQGKRKWGAQSGYNRRSLVENTFSRYKKIIGPMLRARTLQGQRVEARIGSKILNMMTGLGMPKTERIG